MSIIQAEPLIDGYTRHQRVRGFSRQTIRRRRWSLRSWTAYVAAQGVTIATADVGHVEGFIGRLEAPESRKAARSDLRQFYRWAIERGHLTANPVDKLPAPRVPERSASPVAVDDVRRLIASCRPRARLAVMLAAMAGLRVSEIAHLRAEDARIESRTIIVREGKGGSDGDVPMAAELAAELASWPRTGLLLGGSGTSISRLIRANMRRLGIDGRPHDLRHSFLTEVARKTNGNLLLTSKLGRHKRPGTTVRYVRWYSTGHEAVDGLYDESTAA